MSSLENLGKREAEGNASRKSAAESKRKVDKTTRKSDHSAESRQDAAEVANGSITTVFQFKIILKNTSPPIWRRIQVPKEFNFSQFSRAILKAMGWGGWHLHCFRFRGRPAKSFITIGPKSNIDGSDWPWDEGDSSEEDLNEKDEKLCDYFPWEKTAEYEYDFGDCWEHKILFEQEVPAKEGEKYPQCIAGKRACPPEDCGGVDGYEELCKIMRNPHHRDLKETDSWLKDKYKKCDFDPSKFDPKSVTFS